LELAPGLHRDGATIRQGELCAPGDGAVLEDQFYVLGGFRRVPAVSIGCARE